MSASVKLLSPVGALGVNVCVGGAWDRGRVELAEQEVKMRQLQDS